MAGTSHVHEQSCMAIDDIDNWRKKGWREGGKEGWNHWLVTIIHMYEPLIITAKGSVDAEITSTSTLYMYMIFTNKASHQHISKV